MVQASRPVLSRDLRLYDTLRRAKVPFEPIDPAHVRMYVCGPTVYDRAHIGNARPVIVFDVLFRLLRLRFGEAAVTYARNLTDVDDKINHRAHERGLTIRALTDPIAAEYLADTEALGCLPPTLTPRATDHMAEMRDLIDRLVARGVAYVAEEHVLFSVHAMGGLGGMPRYGALSARSTDELLAGARVDVAPYKRDPMDFVLWKPSREAHEPGWPSPAGIATPGRPGWHIECSAMSWAHLIRDLAGVVRCEPAEAGTFDIHGGGIDLVFPHHENELAQSCCALGTGAMARVWMHNGFLQVEGDKMSKSLGNFVTIHDLLHEDAFGGRSWPGAVLKLAMLRTHYRQPIDWTLAALEEAEAALARWEDVAEAASGEGSPDAVEAALADDLNTPAAIAALHAAAHAGDAGAVWGGLGLLGLRRDATPAALAARRIEQARAEAETGRARLRAGGLDVEALLAERAQARGLRDWAASDRIRDQLAAAGVVLKDNRDGTTSWTLGEGATP